MFVMVAQCSSRFSVSLKFIPIVSGELTMLPAHTRTEQAAQEHPRTPSVPGDDAQAPKCVLASILERGLQASLPLAPQSDFCVFVTPTSSMSCRENSDGQAESREASGSREVREQCSADAPGMPSSLER